MSNAICEENKTVGFGEVADQMAKVVEDFLENLQKGTTRDNFLTGEKINSLVKEINQAYSESLTDNWDNYGAKKASVLSFRYARSFALMLTEKLLEIPPEAFIDPDGSMSFDWENINTGASISISFGDDGWIYYSGLYENGNKGKGKEIFDSFMLPHQICQSIIRVVDGE